MLDQDPQEEVTPPGITAALKLGMPPQALALYARWWQLETWLREVTYCELRARDGVHWVDNLGSSDVRRADRDRRAPYMSTLDQDNPLAYLDFSQLIEIIGSNWTIFEHALVERKAWEGRVEELIRVRHRIGHCRRPHTDDLNRVEQMLRDLEVGAFKTLRSYNDREGPDQEADDAVTTGWVLEQHEDATRLVKHARSNYGTRLVIQRSHRPWATDKTASGHLWHFSWFLAGRTLDLPTFWSDSYLKRLVRPLAMHVLSDGPWEIEITFCKVDDAAEVADAVGDAFESILTTSRLGGATLDELTERRPTSRQLGFRVLQSTNWNVIDGSTVPVDIFGVGGGIHQR